MSFLICLFSPQRSDLLWHPCAVVGLVLKRNQEPCRRRVPRALAVASLPKRSGRWSAPVSEPHCVRERETAFERLVGQNILRPQSLVKQVGDFASPGKVEAIPCGEERPHVFPGAVSEILLHVGGGLAAQLTVTVLLCCRRI